MAAQRSEARLQRVRKAQPVGISNGTRQLAGDGVAGAAAGRVHLGRGREQAGRVGMSRLGEQLFGLADLDDRAEIHDGHAMRQMPDHAQVVGDEEDRQMQSALQVQQEIDDLRLHGDVERGHDLVGDQQVRLDRERASDADALALPAAELARIALCRRRGQAARDRATRPRAPWSARAGADRGSGWPSPSACPTVIRGLSEL